MLTTSPSTHTLDVPGARLHYEVRGSGPTLLMIPGGPTDAKVFAGVAPLLAHAYTVVTYDPRGNSRSRLTGPPEDVPVEVQADDAYRLLTATGETPAYVFGSSSGALTGLTLVPRYPGAVRALVAHEPPITELLPDSARHREQSDELHAIYRTQGAGAAIAKFMGQTGLGDGAPPQAPDGRDGPPDPEAAAAMAQMMKNLDFFFAHLLPPMKGYLPDLDALRDSPTRTIVGGGRESKGQVAERAAAALAAALGTPLVEFPGDHGGFEGEPRAFAEVLLRELGG
jgi:pimeloyl-ACP methyl ester carboxylesterase